MMIFQTDNLALLDIWVKLSLYGWVYVLAEKVRFLNWQQNDVGLYGGIFRCENFTEQMKN